MEIRNVGGFGLRVSLVGLGCNNFGMWIGREASFDVIRKALDLGITAFDTADVYGEDGASERILGEGLGANRNDIVLMTKTGYAPDPAARNASRRHLISACEASLKRLRTDWIDVYFMHWPDARTPIEETLRAMDDLIHQGKVRYAGCSNMPGWRVADASWTATFHNLNPFIVAQEQYSLISREIETERLPAIEHFNMGLTPYFPLAGGMLTGKYNADSNSAGRLSTTPALAGLFKTDRNLHLVTRLEVFAKQRGHSVLELAFSWLASKQVVSTIIAGATSAEQLAQNSQAVGWTLSAADLAEIEAISRGN